MPRQIAGPGFVINNDLSPGLPARPNLDISCIKHYWSPSIVQDKMHIGIPYSAILASLTHVLTVSAQGSSCPGALTPSYAQPVFAAGWQGNLIANGLKAPRGLQLDTLGNLLVVQQGVGIVHLQFTDNGGTCLTLAKQTTLITSSDVSTVNINTKKLNSFCRLFLPIPKYFGSLLFCFNFLEPIYIACRPRSRTE